MAVSLELGGRDGGCGAGRDPRRLEWRKKDKIYFSKEAIFSRVENPKAQMDLFEHFEPSLSFCLSSIDAIILKYICKTCYERT